MLIGQFYFKQSVNGNLLGEFSNNQSSINTTESADIIHHNISDFRGTYNTTWQEDGEPFFATLTITFKSNTRGIYSLEWRRNNTIIYWGEALIVDNILVGHYRDFENIN